MRIPDFFSAMCKDDFLIAIHECISVDSDAIAVAFEPSKKEAASTHHVAWSLPQHLGLDELRAQRQRDLPAGLMFGRAAG